MLTLWGGQQRSCDGLTRRTFLTIGAFGPGLSLAGLWGRRAVAGTARWQQAAAAGHRSFGAVVSKLRGGSAEELPPFAGLRGMSRGTEPGYLGVAHRPFTPSGRGLQNLRRAGGINARRLDDRKALLASFDD